MGCVGSKQEEEGNRQPKWEGPNPTATLETTVIAVSVCHLAMRASAKRTPRIFLAIVADALVWTCAAGGHH